VAYKRETKELLDFVVSALTPKKQQPEDNEHLFTAASKSGHLSSNHVSIGAARQLDMVDRFDANIIYNLLTF
jgi:hypothetical protein